MFQALYRKYRPQTFNDIVGQNHIVSVLKNAIDKDQISHAYLLYHNFSITYSKKQWNSLH